MKSFLALALAGVASATLMDSIDYEFMKFISMYNRRYGTREEYMYRLSLFRQAHKEIQEHNADETKTSTMGHNNFSDWTDEEFQATLGFLGLDPIQGGEYAPFTPTDEAEVDWVTKGAVTAVKNQGSCGSCWSFSTTGSMEGAHFIATGELLSLSEQELVDCSHNGNLGCMGGMMDRAFKWTESHPLETEDDYPYQGWTPTKGCRYDSTKGKVAVSSFVDVTPESSDALKAAIAQGPVSVAVQANQKVFQRYTGGIITADCGDKLDHGVLAVGYGEDNGTPYYKVKNSWGADWGEEGYVRIAITDGTGMCGIQSQPSQPTTN